MGLTGANKRTVFILLAGALLVVLNQTLLSPALPSIMQDMAVDATTVQWLTSGYSLVEAIVIPLSAYLLGRFDTRKLFIAGLLIFTCGTLLAAFSPAFIFLLLGRMMQASATGFIMPMVFTLILLIFPREHRGQAMGLVSLVIGFAPAVGPSLSGLLVEFIGWRALFLVVAVVAVIVIALAMALLHVESNFERTTFDKVSVVLSSAGLLSLLYGLSSISSSENIAIPLVLVVIGAILMVFFVKRQFHLEVPFLRVQVLKTKNYRVNVIIVACFQAALVGCGVLLPIFLQNLLGASPLQTGLVMLPGAVIGAITAMFAGRLFDRFGVRKLAIPGTCCAFLGALGMISFGLDSTLVYVACVYCCLELGLQFTMTPLNTWGMNSLDNRVIQHANATSNTINQIGASLGTAILVSISASASFLYPELAYAEQTMAGIHAAYFFTAAMMFVILVIMVIFVRDKKPAGQSSETNIVEGRLDSTDNPDINVGIVMNREPYFVRDDATIRDVAELLAKHKTSGLPVVDSEGKVVAFISDGDIMKYIGRSEASVLDSTMMLYRLNDDEDISSRVTKLLEMNVMQIATKRAICVNIQTPLEDACRLFSEKRLKKVPVLEKGVLVGSLSRSDVIRSTMAHLSEIQELQKESPSTGA